MCSTRNEFQQITNTFFEILLCCNKKKTKTGIVAQMNRRKRKFEINVSKNQDLRNNNIKITLQQILNGNKIHCLNALLVFLRLCFHALCVIIFDNEWCSERKAIFAPTPNQFEKYVFQFEDLVFKKVIIHRFESSGYKSSTMVSYYRCARFYKSGLLFIQRTDGPATRAIF